MFLSKRILLTKILFDLKEKVWQNKIAIPAGLDWTRSSMYGSILTSKLVTRFGNYANKIQLTTFSLNTHNSPRKTQKKIISEILPLTAPYDTLQSDPTIQSLGSPCVTSREFYFPKIKYK